MSSNPFNDGEPLPRTERVAAHNAMADKLAAGITAGTLSPLQVQEMRQFLENIRMWNDLKDAEPDGAGRIE